MFDGYIVNNFGYIYDQLLLRYVFVLVNSYYSYQFFVLVYSYYSYQLQVYDYEGQGIYDLFIKIYRYGLEICRVRWKCYFFVFKRGSSLFDVEEDYFEDSELFIRDMCC